MDERCAGDACAKMKTQTAEEANACMITKAHVNEPLSGCKFFLKSRASFITFAYANVNFQGYPVFQATCLSPTRKSTIAVAPREGAG